MRQGGSHCDLLISAARIIDGSGAAARVANLAVDSGRIADIGACEGWRPSRRIDASGLTLAPGFIDSHSHDDLAVLDTPHLECKISQGVTTVIAGNCGISAAPLAARETMPAPFPLLGVADAFRFPNVASYAATLERAPAAVNLALLAGHSSLRLGALGQRLEREAIAAEVETMRGALRQALREGCIGLSTGLDYPPAAASSTAEIVALAQVLTEFDGTVYATHMRNEGDRIFEAVSETLEIGRRAGVAVIISHLKCAGADNYGRSRQTLAMIDTAAAAGQAVGFDVYPYTASSTSLLPRFVRDAESVLVAESEPHPECNGEMLDRIAARWQCSLDEACERLYPAAAIYFQMSDADLERILRHPGAMIGSDGIASMRSPHPRLWGSFPRVLGRYARLKKLFDLETAVHKMTGLTARRFGLEGRGLLAVGNHADLVLFDAERVLDRASFDDPAQLSDGIVSVWVNGEPGWENGASTRARSGRFLQRAGAR